VTYEPLHHKYRPQKFADLVGQEAVATTLTHALQLQRIAPAYLFSGPRGTGKTSSARILAKSLNCLNSEVPTPDPCGQCNACQMIALGNSLDVIEVDAASNTGVDNIRELIERAQFAPVQCRYKLYCLDEVHMLSTAAFNALLKTLEEPPDRVVFVLATTDPQRVLPTIISRCQRFDFRRIPLQAMTTHLQFIAQQEQIEITDQALSLIAQLAQGGLRDAESLLDQLSLLAEQVTVERVWELAGTVPEQDLLVLVQAIAAQSPEMILERTRTLLDRGREPLMVLQNLTSFYRDLLIAKTAPNRQDLVSITDQTWSQLCEFVQSLPMEILLHGQQHLRSCEIQVKNTTQPRLWLEITLLGLIPTQSVQGKTLPPTMAPVALPTAIAPPSQPVPGPPPRPPVVASQVSTPNIPATPLAASPVTIAAAPRASEPESQIPSVPTAIAPSPPAPVPVPEPEIAIAAAAPPPESASTVEQLAPQPMPQDAAVDLQQMWANLLGLLSPASRALFHQHGQLLSCRSGNAVIGIKTKPLAKIAHSKLPDIEAAFEQLVQRKVKLTLEVLKTEAPSAAVPLPGPAMAPPTPNMGGAPAPMTNDVTALSPPPTPSVAPAAGPVNGGMSQAIAVDDPYSLAGAPLETAAPSPAMSAVEPIGGMSAGEGWVEENELQRAAKSMASFFNGELVNLPED
jgi:DNA polymerase III subunit gamma/tau